VRLFVEDVREFSKPAHVFPGEGAQDWGVVLRGERKPSIVLPSGTTDPEGEPFFPDVLQGDDESRYRIVSQFQVAITDHGQTLPGRAIVKPRLMRETLLGAVEPTDVARSQI
jgi:hypothetical protein